MESCRRSQKGRTMSNCHVIQCVLLSVSMGCALLGWVLGRMPRTNRVRRMARRRAVAARIQPIVRAMAAAGVVS